MWLNYLIKCKQPIANEDLNRQQIWYRSLTVTEPSMDVVLCYTFLISDVSGTPLSFLVF